MSTKLIVWDWDGTLVDSFEVLRKAYNAARREYGMPEWTLEEAHANIALSGRESFPKMFGENADGAAKIFYDIYETEAPKSVVAKPERVALLDMLLEKGVKQVIVSNKRGDILRAECKALGWEHYFDAVIGAGDALIDKPAADPVYLAYNQAKVKVEANHLMIGDMPVDGQTAKAAGIKGLLLIGETQTRETLQDSADYVMEYKKLEGFLQQYWGL